MPKTSTPTIRSSRALDADPRYRVILSACFGETLSKSQIARVKIAEGAIQILAQQGFEDFRLESVAKAAGVSRPLILHYFKNGNAVFKFVVQFIRARLHQYILEGLSSDGGHSEKLFRYIESHFKWLAENPADARVWLLFYHEASKDRALNELHSDLIKIGKERIASLIAPLTPKLSRSERGQLAQDLQSFLSGALLAKATSHEGDSIHAKAVHRSYLRWLNA